MDVLPPFRTLRELLNYVLSLHLRGLQHFATAVHGSADPRRWAVLEFLRNCEAEVVAAIGRYEAQDDEVLQTYLQSIPVAALETATAETVTDGSLDRILDDYRLRDQALIQVYEQLEASLVGPRAKAVFADLAAMNRQNQQRLQQALLDF